MIMESYTKRIMRNFKGIVQEKNGVRSEINVLARDAGHAITSVDYLKPIGSTLVYISEQGDW